jgi:hypothetical protein
MSGRSGNTAQTLKATSVNIGNNSAEAGRVDFYKVTTAGAGNDVDIIDASAKAADMVFTQSSGAYVDTHYSITAGVKYTIHATAGTAVDVMIRHA